jgi:hypothetical protein
MLRHLRCPDLEGAGTTVKGPYRTYASISRRRGLMTGIKKRYRQLFEAFLLFAGTARVAVTGPSRAALRMRSGDFYEFCFASSPLSGGKTGMSGPLFWIWHLQQLPTAHRCRDDVGTRERAACRPGTQ